MIQETLNITESQIVENLAEEKYVTQDLLNPKGMVITDTGNLLLIEAGAAEYLPPYSGKLTVRNRHNGEITQTMLSGYGSLNMQNHMLRDEIKGLADLAPTQAQQKDDSPWLVAFSDYENGSKIIEVQSDQISSLFETQGNISGLCYHCQRNAWYCIKPDTNEVIEFIRGQPERILCVLPNLALGQAPVPVNIVYQKSTGQLLISLFSGELGRGNVFKGIDFGKHQGEIVSVDPENGEVTTLVNGLTLPTGLCLTQDDNLLVTEFCDEFLQPLSPEIVPSEPFHGGYKRFSGKLLKIDLSQRKIQLLATDLDTPSNLAVHKNSVYISEGMGIPGRLIPCKDGGSQPLRGSVRQLTIN